MAKHLFHIETVLPRYSRPMALICASLLMVSPGLSAAQEGFYTGLSGSGLLPSNLESQDQGGRLTNSRSDLDAGWAVNGSLGYRYSALGAAELEIRYGQARYSGHHHTNAGLQQAHDGKLQTVGVAANYYFYPPLESSVQPYAGVGVGATKAISDGLKSADVALSLQGMAGLEVPVDDRLAFHAGYRYIHTLLEDQDNNFMVAHSGGTSDFDALQTHSLEVGFKYRFNGPDEKQAQAYPAVLQEQTDGAMRSSARQGAPFPAKAVSVGAAGSDYRAHLTSYENARIAGMGWAVLEKRHPNLLGPLTPHLQYAMVPGKGKFYRLSAMGLDKASALSLCQKMKQRDQWCAPEPL